MRVVVNSDTELVNEVRKALKENNGYCPCKLKKIPENKCMCKDFLEQKTGLCHCGLYNKVEE